MSDSAGCGIGRSGVAIVALMLTTAIATTGWVVTATSRERVATAPEPRPPETVFLPVIVPTAVPVADLPGDTVEVIAASRDLPVGTMITRDDLKDTVKVVKRPKDGLPPTAVLNPEDLVDKRLSRPIRADEVLTTQDLSKGQLLHLPEGLHMVSLAVNPAQAAAGFVGPGSRVNVLATLRDGNKLIAFPLLVDMLVVAVDTNTTYAKDGTFPTMHTVSFAVQEKQALLLALAKGRGCAIELMLRNPNTSAESDKKYNIDEVIKLLAADERDPAKPPADR